MHFNFLWCSVAANAQAKVSVQARVETIGRVFRDYKLLTARLQVSRGYLGGEDFLLFEDRKANCKREWTCDTVSRVYVSVRISSGGAIVNGKSGGKSWSKCGLDKIMRVLCSGCDRILTSGFHCDT